MKRVNTGFLVVFSILLLWGNPHAQQQKNTIEKGFVAITYGDIGFERPQRQWTLNDLNSANLEWSKENHWSLKSIGLLEAPVTGEITIYAEADNFIRFEVPGTGIIEEEKLENSHSGKFKMSKGELYPCELFYVHDGGKSYVRFYWSWKGQPKILIPSSAISHSIENKNTITKFYKKAKAYAAEAFTQKEYLSVPNPSPKELPTFQAWQRGKETLVGITFPTIPDFTCDTWCYESAVDLRNIIALDKGRMKLIHNFQDYPYLNLITLITPEPGAVVFTAWIEKSKCSKLPIPDKLIQPNMCWQLKRALGFSSAPDPYPEFIKRCFILTEDGLTFLNETNRKEIPVRESSDPVNNPPWVQNYIRNDHPLPKPDPNLWAAYSDNKFSISVLGAVSRDNKYLAAIANNSSITMCQAWHDCMHNNAQWLPKNAPVDQKIWQVKIYAMENNPEALIKRVETDFPHKDSITPDKVKKIKKQGTQAATHQTQGVIQNMPVFLNKTKDRLSYPLSWSSGDFKDFGQWKLKAREVYQNTWQALPPDAPFDPVLVNEQDRGTFIAQKIALNITADSRILTYLLKPKGDGPFPAVLLLHDHSAIFDNGKEKVIRPWGIPEERIKSAQALVEKSYGGRYIGDELAKRGYVCFAIDALNWGDRGGGGYKGQQALASNLLHLGMSFAGLIAHEDVRSAEYLASLPYVDKDRVAAMGLSMGSFRTWQVAAISDHIKVGVAICWMATNEGLMTYFNNQTGGNSSYSMLHPGIFNHLDYPDIASMACPKPMLFFNGEKDRLFPVSSVKAAYQKMREVWDSQKAGYNLITKLWPVPHEFNQQMQEEAFKWLDLQMSILSHGEKK